MDRKDFLKNTCGLGICSCVGLGLLASGKSLAQNNQQEKETPLVPVDSRQIQNVLSYIDSSMNESVKRKIFEKLGVEHITNKDFKNWILENRKNLQGFFDRINTGNDTYWEKIEYNPITSAIIIIGKSVDKCACPYAQHENPPIALCDYCCTGFQKAMFEMLLDKPVTKVKVDESYLYGGKRCSSTMFIKGELQLERG
ncbi:MAG: hypothetical protein JW956_04505 [Calditrichaceae bacterium]|nr:hypothetical protein [Calditrichaceae bacterium]